MMRWMILFLLLPIATVILFLLSPGLGWYLPPNVSTDGTEIDHIYYVILGITAVVFLLTHLFLGFILARYGDHGGRRADFVHGNRRLEILWTLVPGIAMAYIVVVQTPAWVKMTFPSAKPNIAPIAQVVARQFEWRIVYPGPDGQFNTPDDIHDVNELHVPVGETILVHLRSMDVLHSFFLPNARVKQDIVPGLEIPMWFDTTKTTLRHQAEAPEYLERHWIDAGGLALRLQSGLAGGGRPLDQFVAQQLAGDTESFLRSYDGVFQPKPAERAMLLRDLNRLLDREDLFDEARFADIELSDETRAYFNGRRGTLYIKLLNRMFLDDAYADFLRPIDRHFEIVCAELCGRGHTMMRGRLIVHPSREDFEAWLAAKRLAGEAAR